MSVNASYRGRIAPSPTGFLHLGHARTFWIAQERCRKNSGTLILRNEDLDSARCQPGFVEAMYEDLRWFGFDWQEGSNCGGEFSPYSQSERLNFYRTTFEKLHAAGFVYPCSCSRRDVLRALQAPHLGEEEPVYPGTCRNTKDFTNAAPRSAINWRFRVPDGEIISFNDGNFGSQSFVAGKDFGDFVVWRHDDIPSYQLAVTVDDAAMKITEVVRGADLLLSTARQILIYRALGLTPPDFYHCDLLTDANGIRLAKRNDALSLRTLRREGCRPKSLRKFWSDCRQVHP